VSVLVLGYARSWSQNRKGELRGKNSREKHASFEVRFSCRSRQEGPQREKSSDFHAPFSWNGHFGLTINGSGKS
jgi:hypothetical protein